MSFMRMLSAGPDVSLKGSPTVSPVTAASCAGVELPLPSFLRSAGSGSKPPEMYFFALSQAPPLLDMEMASWTPETRPPVRMPNTASTPKNVPATSGVSMTNAAGAIISLSEAFVEISTQAS